MSSDRERISNDPPQQYRSVVFQQGRVTLGGDANVVQDIVLEEIRADVDDIVGPVGTPDDGYAISYPGKVGPSDFTIGKGTMYLGGERLELLNDITFYGQKDGEWLDFPDAIAMSDIEEAWLYVREQELGAVEDPNLLEVALGGPDTAERTRFVQRFMRDQVDSTDCEIAWGEVLAEWNSVGYDFDSKLMRFLPYARLQVGFAGAAPNPDPCEPAAQGGYLGADNQCIRVMVTEYDAKAQTAKIVWAFDNAYHMFKVVVQNDKVTLKLSAPPVDAFHWPRSGQAVEILRSAVRLADGYTMAQDHGVIGTLTADYNADQRTVQLVTALTDPPFTPNTTDPPVFMRLWEEQLDVTIGKPVVLGDTGLEVTLTADGGNAVAVGVYWIFAVRPTTPQEVYPQRYVDGPQPPEGPRQWGCPLAILQWIQEFPTIFDCRDPFDNLVELTKHKNGCCELTVGLRGTYPDLETAFADVMNKKLGSVGLCLLPEPAVHKVHKPIKVHHDPLLRVEVTGSGPMTVVEIDGGGFDVQGIQAFALNKLHVRLMDVASLVSVRHCDSLEIHRCRIDRIPAVQTTPMVISESNRIARVEDSVLDAGHASYSELIKLLATSSPLAMTLFALELLSDPIEEAIKRLTPVSKLSENDVQAFTNGAKDSIQTLLFDKSPYSKEMAAWFRLMSQVPGAPPESLTGIAKELKSILHQIVLIQQSTPGLGIVLDHVGDNWLESNEFPCVVSFSGVPGERLGGFEEVRGVFGDNVQIEANGKATHISNNSFDLLTYGESFVKWLKKSHGQGDLFHVPTSMVAEGNIFRVAPAFFFGEVVFLTNNRFVSNFDNAAWVISSTFAPLSNTGSEGPIVHIASNNVDPFRPLNFLGLVP